MLTQQLKYVIYYIIHPHAFLTKEKLTQRNYTHAALNIFAVYTIMTVLYKKQ
jgi:hypothetical protein